MAADVGWSSWFLLTACNTAKTSWISEGDYTAKTPWLSKDDYTAKTYEDVHTAKTPSFIEHSKGLMVY